MNTNANTSTDYYGKKADMSLYPKKILDMTQVMGFGKGEAQVIAGPLKAAQNYIRVLLSPMGSRHDDESFGTDFLADLSSRNLFLPIQIYQAFSINSLKAVNWLKTKYVNTTKPDEKVELARMTNYTVINKTSINFEIELFTSSKEKLLFLLPVVF